MHSVIGDFCQRPVEEVARDLLGCFLVRTIYDQRLVGRIVETEAYDQFDAASHSHNGPGRRSKIMFEAPGRLYVYQIYGLYNCCNIVTGQYGEGAAVLIRAIEPLQGIEMMQRLRSASARGGELTSLRHPTSLMVLQRSVKHSISIKVYRVTCLIYLHSN